jgi:hypothetical protein
MIGAMSLLNVTERFSFGCWATAESQLNSKSSMAAANAGCEWNRIGNSQGLDVLKRIIVSPMQN